MYVAFYFDYNTVGSCKADNELFNTVVRNDILCLFRNIVFSGIVHQCLFRNYYGSDFSGTIELEKDFWQNWIYIL